MNSSQTKLTVRKGFHIRKKDEVAKLAALRVRETKPTQKIIDRECAILTCKTRFTHTLAEVQSDHSLHSAKLCLVCRSKMVPPKPLTSRPFEVLKNRQLSV